MGMKEIQHDLKLMQKMGMLDDFVDYTKKNKLDELSDEEHEAFVNLLEL